MKKIPLGQHTEYPQTYSPGILFPVPRADARRASGIIDQDAAGLPFRGTDFWRGYELSWLDGSGKPQVSIAEFEMSAESPNLIESKSFKLYLNSLNMTRFNTREDLMSTLEQDLSAVAGMPVSARLVSDAPLHDGGVTGADKVDCILLDELAAGFDGFEHDASLLKCGSGISGSRQETLVSHLFRSLCPVTAQPDWGSVFIRYAGVAMDHESVLRYLLAYRQHQGFHEDCVERIFCDLQRQCQPEWLVVGIQFLRRGGLEINPWRWSESAPVSAGEHAGLRTARQ